MSEQTKPEMPEYVPLKIAKYPDEVAQLREALEVMWTAWNTDELIWLVGMLCNAIGDGEFLDPDDEGDDDSAGTTT